MTPAQSQALDHFAKSNRTTLTAALRALTAGEPLSPSTRDALADVVGVVLSEEQARQALRDAGLWSNR